MMGLNERVASIDVPIGPDSEKTLVETLADHNAEDPADIIQDNNIRDSIDGWLNQLPEKQREVLARRFGLRGHEMSTLEEVGEEIGLTRERVRQIQVDALKRLREILEGQGLSSESLFN
jgi:RNA polymerase nonessential primary-like sigma factor